MHLGDKCVHVMPDEIPRYLDMGYVRGATETQKKHISEKAKGRTGPSSTFYGRHHSEYSKKLIGSAAKGRPGFGDQNIAKRPEVRKKISQYALTHSNYFRSHKFYYVNNGEIELRILAEEPVPEGFVKGRIPHCWIHNDANEYYVSVRDLSTKLKSSYARGRLAKV